MLKLNNFHLNSTECQWSDRYIISVNYFETLIASLEWVTSHRNNISTQKRWMEKYGEYEYQQRVENLKYYDAHEESEKILTNKIFFKSSSLNCTKYGEKSEFSRYFPLQTCSLSSLKVLSFFFRPFILSLSARSYFIKRKKSYRTRTTTTMRERKKLSWVHKKSLRCLSIYIDSVYRRWYHEESKKRKTTKHGKKNWTEVFWMICQREFLSHLLNCIVM